MEQKEKNKRFRENNPDWYKTYYEENKDYLVAVAGMKYYTQKPKYKGYDKEEYKKNKEKHNKASRDYYQRNREKILAKMKAKYSSNTVCKIVEEPEETLRVTDASFCLVLE